MHAKNLNKISNGIWFLLIKLVILPVKLVGHLVKKIRIMFGLAYSIENHQGYYVFTPGKKKQRKAKPKAFLAIFCLLFASNLLTYFLFGKSIIPIPIDSPFTFSHSEVSVLPQKLFLKDKAAIYISNIEQFEEKVKRVSSELDIAPEWLMAVMYSESKFNPSALNFRGSGATGLIQIMVPALKDINDRLGTEYYMSDLKKMNALNQLDLVAAYLSIQKERYRGYNNLTDLYLAILFPRALSSMDKNYTLYANPSRAYKQNRGLDENKDGRVSILDIDQRMERMYADAYHAPVR